MTPTLRLSKLLIVLLFILTSCQKDDSISNDDNQNENIPDTFSEYFGNEISRDFLGSVIDKDHNPIEGVSISIGNETAVTDSNGVFIIRNATVNERFGYIKAEKAGYIHGSRSVVPSNGTNKVTIMLLEETVVGTVSSGSSDTVIADDGSSVSFDGNFVKEDGTAYTGSVNVIMHHLDPTDEDMEDQMPGMLYAENEDGAERMLQTLGMLAVELRGSGGEDLNLAEGSTSEIKIPVDATLLGSAPATIPLWYFDEATGYWKEEGEATLQGNMYVGTVSHFSFWNCDIPAEAVTLCLTVVDEDDKELNNLYVTLTSETYGTTSGNTNELGQVCGLVPSNETLILDIYSYAICGNTLLHTETIGPFTSDTITTIIVPDIPEFNEETVTGIFKDCDGDLITNGYVKISYGNQIFTDIVTDGSFESNLLVCSQNNTFSIFGYDYMNYQTTGNINFTFDSPIIDVGSLSACNSVIEFIEYAIDGGESISFTENLSASFDSEDIPWVYDVEVTDQDNCFQILGNLTFPDYLGTYNDYVFYGEPPQDYGFRILGQCLNLNIWENDIIYHITSVGEIGEYIDINFSGSFEDTNGIPHTIVGVAHVIRDN